MQPSRADVEAMVAALFTVNASLISRQVQALEQAGYLAFSSDPEDHRAWRVALTPVGAEEHRRLHEHGVGRYVSFVADWEDDEAATFTRLLSKFEASKRAAVEQETRQTRRSRWTGLRGAIPPSGTEAER